MINDNSSFAIEGLSWNLIGRLEEGQSIIGSSKSSTNKGSIISHDHGSISHKHKIGTGKVTETENGSHKKGEYGIFFSWEGLNSSGDAIPIGREIENNADDGTFFAETNNIPYTENISLHIPIKGGEYNKAYGLGIGNKYIWERIG